MYHLIAGVRSEKSTISDFTVHISEAGIQTHTVQPTAHLGCVGQPTAPGLLLQPATPVIVLSAIGNCTTMVSTCVPKHVNRKSPVKIQYKSVCVCTCTLEEHGAVDRGEQT